MKGSAKILRGGLINEVICARVALVTLASRLITLVVSPWASLLCWIIIIIIIIIIKIDAKYSIYVNNNL